VTTASQPSDRLRQILREHSRAAGGPPPRQAPLAPGDALLEREGALPDALALARLYRNKDLVERLPEEDDVAAPESAPPPAVIVERGKQYVQSPPLSPSEVRAAIRQLQVEFSPHDAYQLIEPARREEELLPLVEELELREEAEPEGEGLRLALTGAVILLVVGVFIWLALFGPLRAH